MERVRSILSIVLLIAVLAALGSAGTRYAIQLELWLSVPIIVAIWSALGLLGIGIYEYGKADTIRISELRMKNTIPPPAKRK